MLSLGFTEIVEDGASGLVLGSILGDRTALLEAVQSLAGKELGVAALETLTPEVSEVLPWILAFGSSGNMDGPLGRKAFKQHLEVTIDW